MDDETTPHADPYANTEEIAALVKRKWDEWQRGRENFVWAAYRNIHYYNGRQWIRFDRSSLTGWRPVRLGPGTPTPVTVTVTPGNMPNEAVRISATELAAAPLSPPVDVKPSPAPRAA